MEKEEEELLRYLKEQNPRAHNKSRLHGRKHGRSRYGRCGSPCFVRNMGNTNGNKACHWCGNGAGTRLARKRETKAELKSDDVYVASLCL